MQAHSQLPEVKAYQAHLDSLAASAPVLLAAHAFTQLLAVASGGQILARMIKKGLRLPEGEGVAAYTYATGQPRALKAALKLHIDSLQGELSAAEVEALVGEHCKAFSFNNAIIRGYRIGYASPLVAAWRLCLPTSPQQRLKVLGSGAAAVALLAVFIAWSKS